jgi:hypothetical protein
MKEAYVRKGITSVFGLLLGVASATLVQGGCVDECEEYVECTAAPGLRYVLCGEADYRFNDGAELTSEAAAFDYCYCNQQPLECTDGATAKMCNTMPVDGRASFQRSDGAAPPLLDGVAACVGVSPCELSTENCDFESWYLKCGSGSARVFVMAQGTVFGTEAEAVAACNLRDRSGSCRRATDNCSTLTNCRASDACWSDVLDECRSSPLCSSSSDESRCIADPACQWEYR